MAEDNAELFRRCAQAVTSDDEASLLELTDADIEVVALRSGTEGAFRGHDGVRAFLADNRESFDRYEARYEEVKDLGDGRVLALGTIHIRGRESGIETEVPTAVIATFREGLLVHFMDYAEREKALAAAGLA
jgi:ketosteroid isomerase-like protein